jgi:hypothetical protein
LTRGKVCSEAAVTSFKHHEAGSNKERRRDGGFGIKFDHSICAGRVRFCQMVFRAQLEAHALHRLASEIHMQNSLLVSKK